MEVSELGTGVKKSNPAANVFQRDAEEFLEIIVTDFYVRLPDYAPYVHSGFKTDDLSMTELISIVECYALEGTTPNIAHTIDIGQVLGVVLFRLSHCPDSIESMVMKELKELSCFLPYTESKLTEKKEPQRSYASESVIDPEGVSSPTVIVGKDGQPITMKGSSMTTTMGNMKFDKFT